jgi:Secretion system C-terminal sorting domain
MEKRLLSVGVFLLLVFSAQAKNYYVATNGNDTTGVGTIALPYHTIIRAQQSVVAGDTVFVRGGTYRMSGSNISQKFTTGPYAVVHYLNKSGSSASKRICYWAYPGEHPVFDMSDVKPSGYRNTVFYVTGSWIHIKGLEVIGTQVTISTHTQSECFRNEGSNNLYELLKMHDGMGIGFYLTKGANNLVLNCDAFNNWDYYSETGKGGNTDGFGFHPATGGTGNKISGCRAWFNSDDGFDCINAREGVVFDNCWAFYNGYNSSFASEGDGNGFKAGGYGQAPVVSSLPSPIPAHTVQFCLAYRNKANGFYSNHHVVTGSYFYNNTAYRNATNYNMLSQQITKSSTTGNDTTIDCAGINHVLHNNLSFRYSAYTETVNFGTSVDTYNSFSTHSGITVNASDFVTTDESLLVTDRQDDGGLPDIGFLKLKEGSDLIDKGFYLGFAYSGTAPDLGAFEYESTIASIDDVRDTGTVLFYPNPVAQTLHFGSMRFSHLTIYDLNGRQIANLNYAPSIDVSFLSKGCYLIYFQRDDRGVTQSKLMKE